MNHPIQTVLGIPHLERTSLFLATAFAALALLGVLSPPVFGQTDDSESAADSKLTVADYLDWETVADPQISPDGSRIIYTRRWINKMEDKWESALWIMRADGSKNHFLIKGSNARWSPDGSRILFLADGEPKGSQLFVRWMDAEGAVSQVTRVEQRPQNPRWAPDGSSIAFVSIVAAKSKWEVGLPSPPEGATWTERPRIVDRLHYRQDRVGFTEPGFMHLFVVTAEGGTPRQLTSGEWNVGTRFDGLASGAGFDWGPDGRAIVFDGLREMEGDYAYRQSHIYSVDITTKEIVTLTSRPGFWTDPVVSPDSRKIAFVGYDSTRATYAMSRLHVMLANGADFTTLTGDYDRQPQSLRWSTDGEGLFFTSQDQGFENVGYASVQGQVRTVTEGKHSVSLTSVATDGRRTAVGILHSPTEPGDVVRYSLTGRSQPDEIRRLTDVNSDVLAGKPLGEMEEVWFTSTGDTRVQGWIVKPPSFDPNTRYPLVLEIHGGPFSMYRARFDFRYQVFAANGYVVLYTNPRGSTGYGEAFSQAIDHAYPSVDYEDLMAGVDHVASQGYVDESRMYVGGCSGGGVLSSWVIGHTDRFAAAAVRCPVTNWISMAGQTDIPFFTHSFFEKPYWNDPTRWLEQSSVMYAGNVKTPTLVMTGEDDFRTPMPQSEEYFAALKMVGVPTRLVRFNGEYHGTGSKPSNYMRTLLYMMDWYGQHTLESNIRPEDAPGK
jgi:dipeptidyl aminopeptidase/acylaminoacyl peptidase